ncbi:unnamed protein product [Peniophora sp. CBMAI 1063]|nr:unnamed protein product [Peniophora sp. CBMAI 1063]
MNGDLPSELLLKIFIEVRNACPAGWKKRPSCWALSHACRRWRMLALDSSVLWTQLPLESSKWVEACLSRSRDGSLEVKADPIMPESHAERGSLRLLYHELHRIESFEFVTKIDHKQWTELVMEVFDGLHLHPAPRLRKLKISILDGHDVTRGPISLSGMFKSQQLLALESAIFGNCNLTARWSKTMFPSTLRSLTLCQSTAWKSSDEMVEFFQLVPNLQSLDLNVVPSGTHGFHASRSPKYSRRAASLPKLETFSLAIRFVEQVAALTYLSIPLTASLRVRAIAGDKELMKSDDAVLTGAIDQGTDAYREHFATAVADGHGYTQLRASSTGIEASSPYRGEAHQDGLPRALQTLAPPDLGPLDLHFNHPRASPHLLGRAYGMILEQPVFATVRSLQVISGLPQEAWTCFERYTAVEELELSQSAGISALPGFVAAINRQTFPLFPALGTLRIVETAIVQPDELQPDFEGSGSNEHVHGEGRYGADARGFVDAMKILASYEHFERLVFSGCTMSSQTLQAVKGVLGDERVEGDVLSVEEVPGTGEDT